MKKRRRRATPRPVGNAEPRVVRMTSAELELASRRTSGLWAQTPGPRKQKKVPEVVEEQEENPLPKEPKDTDPSRFRLASMSALERCACGSLGQVVVVSGSKRTCRSCLGLPTTPEQHRQQTNRLRRLNRRR